MVANKDFQQAVNRALIRRSILAAGGATRADLARTLGMYRSTVSNLTEGLLDEGWLIESGAAENHGVGRKGTVLRINPDHGLAAGIALRRKGRYEVTLVDPAGQNMKVETGTGPENDLPGLVKAALNRADREARRRKLPLLGAGISLSGPVDHARQRIVWSEQFGLRDVDFAPMVGERRFPVFLENDSQCCAWGQAWNTGNRGSEDFAYLYLNLDAGQITPDLSFGLGIFLNGQAYHGAHRFAGEFPTTFIRDIDRKIRGRESHILKNPPDLRTAGSKFITESIDRLLDMIQFLDPHKFYLGHYLEPYRSTLDAYLETKGDEILFDVEYAGLGPYESAFGAACYLLTRIYEIPVAGPTDQ